MRMVSLPIMIYALAGTISAAWLVTAWMRWKRASAFGDERLLGVRRSGWWALSPVFSVAAFSALATSLAALPAGPKPSGNEPIDIVIERKTVHASADENLELTGTVLSILGQGSGHRFTLSVKGDALVKVVPETSDVSGIGLLVGDLPQRVEQGLGSAQSDPAGTIVEVRGNTDEQPPGAHAVARIGAAEVPTIYWIPGGSSWSPDPNVLRKFLEHRAAAETEAWIRKNRSVFRWSVLAFLCIFAEIIWKFSRG
jgi:hypothetical protein